MTVRIHLAIHDRTTNEPVPCGMATVRYGRTGGELRLVADLPSGPRRLVVRERPCGRVEPVLDEDGRLLPYIGGENPDAPCPLHEGRGRYEQWILGEAPDVGRRADEAEAERSRLPEGWGEPPAEPIPGPLVLPGRWPLARSEGDTG